MITYKVQVLVLVTTKLHMRALLCAINNLWGTLRGEGGNNHIKELIKESKKSKGEKGENTIKEANFAKVKIFFQGLHDMTFLC
jgi:hypothetical protein